MAIPGFVVEASLYRSAPAYHGRAMYAPDGGGIRPAVINPDCFNGCYNDCNQGCFGLTGQGRSACLRDCKQIEIDCRNQCTEPGSGPTVPHTDQSLGVIGDFLGRMVECTICCSEGARSIFQRTLYDTCVKFCLIAGCNVR